MLTDNPTLMLKGEDKSLIWEFALTADEQTKNHLFHFVKWQKFNQSSLAYDLVGGKTFVKAFGSIFINLNVWGNGFLISNITYEEPIAPHIEVDKNRQATLLINNVRREDEGTYKIEYSVQLDTTFNWLIRNLMYQF